MSITHKFELAGLGVAPFQYVGSEYRWFSVAGGPAKPGSSCDYCGHAIAECCFIVDASGKRFKVGNECVLKTGDSGLIDTVKRDLARLRREEKAKRDAIRIDAARKLLESPAIRESLAKREHPLLWLAAQNKTLLDWADWMMAHAGTTGRLQVCRIVEKVRV